MSRLFEGLKNDSGFVRSVSTQMTMLNLTNVGGVTVCGWATQSQYAF